MENHHFQRVNPLFLRPLSSSQSVTNYQRVSRMILQVLPHFPKHHFCWLLHPPTFIKVVHFCGFVQVFARFMAKWWYFIELCGGFYGGFFVVVINGMSAIVFFV